MPSAAPSFLLLRFLCRYKENEVAVGQPRRFLGFKLQQKSVVSLSAEIVTHVPELFFTHVRDLYKEQTKTNPTSIRHGVYQ
jgi:hypothetical protein